MRLALICTDKLPSPAVRGGAIQMMIDGISPVLVLNHQLTIYSITDSLLPDQETRDGVRYIRFPMEKYVAGVAGSLKEHKYDVVHVFNRPISLISYKKAAPESRFVLSLHNDMFAEKKISDEDANLCVHYVQKITTVSKYIKKTVTDRIPKSDSKIEPIYSGFDPKSYHPIWTRQGKSTRDRMRSKYGVSNKKVILFVGRLSAKKGPHLLIQSMSQVLKKNPDAVLIIVGGKWYSNDEIDVYGKTLRELAGAYKNKVIFTKFVAANVIQDYFAMGDVFVCSSQWEEPLARVHYEAMAAGIPIITTDRGGNAEVITHKFNGLIVSNYQSAISFARSINYMLANKKEASSMARKGRELVDSRYTFEHVAQRLNKIYMEAAIDGKPSLLAKELNTEADGNDVG